MRVAVTGQPLSRKSHFWPIFRACSWRGKNWPFVLNSKERLDLLRVALVVFVMPVLLSACSVFSPVKTEQPTLYVLNTLPPAVTKKPIQRYTLAVAQPATSQIYSTTDMAYTTAPYQIAYFAKSRWADTPAHMMQSLLVQSLQNTHYFYAIGSPMIAGHYDYLLTTQLLQFQQRFFTHTSDVSITLRAQLIKTANNQVVATKLLTVMMPAPERTPYGGVVAANRATAMLVSQLTQFCLQHVQ